MRAGSPQSPSERLHLRLDCASGLAGDMFLAACVDAGAPREALTALPRRLGLEGVGVEFSEDSSHGIAGLRCRVVVEREDQPHRGLRDILERLAGSGLPEEIRARAEGMFRRLAEVEASIHGTDPERVHFHELGAADSMVDILGAAVAMDALGDASRSLGVVATGTGTVATAHGILPVPAPATQRLLRGIPVLHEGEGELTTPTGALILSTWFADGPTEAPNLSAERDGWGLGTRRLRDRPNACRLVVGREAVGGRSGERVAVIDTHVDDSSGELVAASLSALLEAGALDVAAVPATMKKGRPGLLLRVICEPERSRTLAEVLLRQTGSLGCRLHHSDRIVATREEREIETPWGRARVKVSHLGEEVLRIKPEADSCSRLAAASGLTWREVHERVVAMARESLERSDGS